MLTNLNELLQTKEYALLFSNAENTEAFHYGQILAIDDKFTAVQTIAVNGNYDGIIVMPTDMIYRIETGGQYDQRMKKLMYDKYQPSIELDLRENDIVSAILKISQAEKKIISVELLNSGMYDIMGFTNSVNRDECVIQTVTEDGKLDGISHIRLCAITGLAYSRSEENLIYSLTK